MMLRVFEMEAPKRLRAHWKTEAKQEIEQLFPEPLNDMDHFCKEWKEIRPSVVFFGHGAKFLARCPVYERKGKLFFTYDPKGALDSYDNEGSYHGKFADEFSNQSI